MMFENIIFDLDGTLLNTGKGVVESLRYTLKKIGIKENRQEVLESFVGPPVAVQMRRVYGLSEEKSQEAMVLFREQYAKGDIYLADHYEDMEYVLKTLQKQGYRLAVATYKREDMAQNLLGRMGLAQYFDVIHGSDIDGKLTKQDIVELCIRDLDANRKNTALIGDSDNDAIGAEKASIAFVGVLYGYGFKRKEDLLAYNAIGVAKSCRDILKILNVKE